jgi:hypothetical protein
MSIIPATQESGGSRVQSQPGLQSEIVSQKIKIIIHLMKWQVYLSMKYGAL